MTRPRAFAQPAARPSGRAAAQAAPMPPRRSSPRFRHRRHAPRLLGRPLTLLTRQLAGLLHAGIPLLAALDLLACADDGRAPCAVLSAIRHQLVRGRSLADALRQHPRTFDAFYLQLVTLGESSGRLADMLLRLAEAREHRERHRQQVRQALVYPAFVCAVALGVVLALMIWAVPAFQHLFDDFGAVLPPLTRAVLNATDGLLSYGWIPMVGAVLAGAGTRLGWQRSPTFRHAAHARWLRLPLVGPLCTQTALGQWASGLAVLLLAGTPLVDALRILGAGHAQPVFAHASARLAHRLQNGERLATAMAGAGCFPASAVRSVALAEHTGALDRMLNELGQRYAADAQARVAAWTRIVEPLVISLCGGIVALLVVALYLPIIELGNVV
ncbi:type II secretion system F family protein [Robbsia sp. Bb-Pol-6]|uniref:Type II secretion system F family protein n=1 Tax=Robbsia betulipollinis TaxID=2981849 RepID=A0ABT3ZSQ4_9BURK|nr:type II secretion system F family protein [Robbsia betulipollinis]MCY0388923.1 type II secretion system F family protein [Robbsia betulipollinis]